MADSPPLSPWAERFGYNVKSREPFIDDSIGHSGLAPVRPPLHPKFYADKPLPAAGPLTEAELDTLFCTESFQNTHLRGHYSWMTGPLMSYLFFSNRTGVIAGGHREADYGPVDPDDPAHAAYLAILMSPPTQTTTDNAPATTPISNPDQTPGQTPGQTPATPATPSDNTAQVLPERREDVALRIFHSERIQVDETKWFPFLKKTRWLDWDKPDPALDGGNWSVDNPKIWDIMRISIELVDRIFKALVADKHVMLETVLYGLHVPWENATQAPLPFEGAHFLLSRPYIQASCDASGTRNPIDFVAQFSPEDWATRLKLLLRDQVWGYVENFNGTEGTWGVTLGRRSDLILIDVGIIRRLLSDEITLAERCILQYLLAMTMMHELFHALFHTREMDDTWPEDLPSIELTDGSTGFEPFIDGDAVTELGFAAEQRIFGGALWIGLRRCGELPLGVYLMSWPSPYEVGGGPTRTIKTHKTFQAGRRVYITRVPTLFVSKMLSAAFWDDDSIEQKSANYFHATRIFTNDTTYAGPGLALKFSPTTLNDNLTPSLKPGEAEMINAWHERIREWNARRAGWYNRSHRLWRSTPWSGILRRRVILWFSRSFRLREEIECQWIARSLVERVDWTPDRDRYLEDLPPVAEGFEWIFHAIGLLMLAALPIREKELSSTDKVRVSYGYDPSKDMTDRLRKSREIIRLRRPEQRVIPPSVLYDPLGRPGKVLNAADPDVEFFQEDYLDVLARLIEHLAASGVVVSATWLHEILNAANHVRNERRDLNTGARDKHSWIQTWKFNIPVYDNRKARFENGKWEMVD